MSSKSKSGLSETPSKATPRVSKLSRGVPKSDPDTPSPPQSSRLSIDKSPRPLNSKPAIERRSPKLPATPEKPQSRLVKASELQTQLNHVQEDLKKAKEQITVLEKEKAQAVDELKEAQKVAKDANERLQEALVAQKQAEESSEIEKFRAVELEQAGIEMAQKKEDEWKKELEVVRSQHAVDVAALLSTTQELQKVEQELVMLTETKNQALSHADDATKIAEIHAEKVELLSNELIRLKKIQLEANESNKMVLQLKEEREFLKQDLFKAKDLENKLTESESFAEQLNVELEAAKMAESYAHSLVEEWKSRVDELEIKLEKANKLERSASESLESVMRQLEGNNDLLHETEAEMAALKEKVGLLEMTVRRQKADIEESEHCLSTTKEEAAGMATKLESLKAELETVKEEKSQALNNEKLAASSVQVLLEEKNKLINELENSREEEEKSKKAMESLASALHEVSAEAREAQEKLLSSQVEHESYEAQIENLRLVLKEANERYENMLDDSKHEIDFLKSSFEKSKEDGQNSKEEWEQKEQNLVKALKRSEEENTSLEKEIDRLINLLKHTEEEACSMREEEAQLKYSLKEVETEVVSLQESLGEARVERMKLKENLMDKENELQNIIQENEELRTREAISLKKVEELSKLLEEAKAQKQTEENGELTDSEKDYDLLPKVVEFSEENGHVREKPKKEAPSQDKKELSIEIPEEAKIDLEEGSFHFDATKSENVNAKLKDDESKQKEDDTVEVGLKMWESCKIEKKEFSPEREQEQESVEEEVDSKMEGKEGFDQINVMPLSENGEDNSISPSKQQHQKKKKPWLRKLGSLLKKKSTSNQK